MAEPSPERPVAGCVEALRKSSGSDLAASLSVPAMLAAGFLLAHRFEELTASGILPCLLLLALSVILSAVAAARAEAKCAEADLLPTVAVGLGARTGLLVFLLGGGSFLLGRVARQALAGVPLADLPWTAWLPPALAVMLAFLPTVALGSLSAVLVLARPSSGRSGRPARPKEARSRSGPALPLAASVFILGLLAPAIAAVLSGHSSTRPTAASSAMAPAPQELPFPHEPQTDLKSASAGRWMIAASLPVPGLEAGAASAFPAKGSLLAFASGGGVAVRDLRSAAGVRRFHLPSAAQGLSWAPSGDRLICRCADGSLHVLDPDGTATALPVRGILPEGCPRWNWAGEVGFYQGDHRSGALDLETLRLRTFGPPPPRQGGRTPTLDLLAETARCRLVVRPRVSRLATPLDPPAGEWSFEASAALFVEDKETGAAFPLVDLAPGTEILVSPDASVITLVDVDGATAHYVALSGGEPATVEVALPRLPEHAPGSALAALAVSGRVAAFVCAPLVNPLNGKVVGPDTRQVRALAVCDRWEPEGGTLRVAETYQPVRVGDVAGCLHHWQEGGPVLLSGAGLEDWWAPCVAVERPGASRVPSPRRRDGAELAATPGGTAFRGWREGPSRGLPAVVDVGKLALGLKTASVTPPPAAPPSPDRQKAASASPEALIGTFVREHHAKVGRGDADGFASDYAAAVDLGDKGTVGPEFIRRDQEAYLSRYERISETVEGPVAVSPAAAGWRASYVIRSFAVKRFDGREFDRRVRIALDIREGPRGFAIHRERAGDAD